MTDWKIDLPTFRGPLDLLLHLVKHHEVDVCDIPIAKVAEQFLRYLELMEWLDVEQAGDFMVMAATLMEIKSKSLLPRSEEDAVEEADDPRQELVKQLVEYKRFRDAANLLEAQARQWQSRFSRQVDLAPPAQDPSRQPLRSVELWDLVSAFGRLMRESLALQPQQIVVDETPQHVYAESLLAQLQQEPRIPLTTAFSPPHTRGRLVGLFLAILELIKNRRLRVEQPTAFGELWLIRVEDEPSPSAMQPEPQGQTSII